MQAGGKSLKKYMVKHYYVYLFFFCSMFNRLEFDKFTVNINMGEIKLPPNFSKKKIKNSHLSFFFFNI